MRKNVVKVYLKGFNPEDAEWLKNRAEQIAIAGIRIETTEVECLNAKPFIEMHARGKRAADVISRIKGHLLDAAVQRDTLRQKRLHEVRRLTFEPYGRQPINDGLPMAII